MEGSRRMASKMAKKKNDMRYENSKDNAWAGYEHSGNRDISGGIFICTQFVLYVTYLVIDIHPGLAFVDSKAIKFSCIVLCFLHGAALSKLNQETSGAPLLGALFFTALADVFLVFTSIYLVGVLLFCVVQVFYYEYLKGKEEVFHYIAGNFMITSVLTMGFVILILPYTGLGDFNLAVIFWCIYYMIELLRNLVTALRCCNCVKTGEHKTHLIFTTALFMLLLCDIQVGLYNIIGSSIFIKEELEFLYQFSQRGMWIVYVPAQLLIVEVLYLNCLRQSRGLWPNPGAVPARGEVRSQIPSV